MVLRFFLLSIMSMSLIFSSCKKESNPPAIDANETVNNQIASGSWTVTSWTANGVELIQSVYNSVIITCTKEDKNNGTVVLAMIDMGGGSQNETDKYMIRNNGKEIEIDGDVLTISVSGTNLTLEGNIQGVAAKITAKK